jgi:5-methylcytosine-specific restriction endonuclease McrA
MNDLWKPDKATVIALSGWKKKQKKPTKAQRKKQLRRKRADAKAQRENARKNVIRYFGLHQYATNMGICLRIHNDHASKMPPNDKEAWKLILAFANHITGKPSKRFQTDKQFYSSQKWKEIRYIALQQSGGKCTLCGASSKDGVQLHVDHIIPRSIAPKKRFDLDNLQILCSDCNLGKSNYDTTDWR